MKHIAVYARVSSRKQDTRSQEPDLRRWVHTHANGTPVRWYRDTFTGKTMDRPGWQRLKGAIDLGNVAKVVVWRLDRLGRTVSGLTSLFEELQARGVGFESVRDRVDLSTAAGRLMAHVLASVAAYENEVRSERIVAGQRAARRQGKRWGGSVRGRRIKVTAEQVRVIHQLEREGSPVAAISRAVNLSRPTVYTVLAGR